MSLKISHIGLVVKDCEKSCDFYCRILNCKKLYSLEHEGLKMLYLQADSLVIELLQYKVDPQPNRETGYFDHLAFQVDDIDRTVSSLIELDVEFLLDQPKNIGVRKRIIFLSGPDGERIELVQEN